MDNSKVGRGLMRVGGGLLVISLLLLLVKVVMMLAWFAEGMAVVALVLLGVGWLIRKMR